MYMYVININIIFGIFLVIICYFYYKKLLVNLDKYTLFTS